MEKVEKIRVVVVDDVDDIREHIMSSLAKEVDIEIVGQAATGLEAVEKVRRIKPDVVLLDILMESPTAGLDAAQQINKEFPDVSMIILTINEDSHLMFQAYCFGVMDYILKTSPVSEIAVAIRNSHNNTMMIRPNVATKLVDEFSRMRMQQESMLFTYNIISKLSNSEFDVLTMVFDGYRYKEIADLRFVSLVTIKSQVNSILKKFERKNMKEVINLLEQMNFREMIKNIRPDLMMD